MIFGFILSISSSLNIIHNYFAQDEPKYKFRCKVTNSFKKKNKLNHPLYIRLYSILWENIKSWRFHKDFNIFKEKDAQLNKSDLKKNRRNIGCWLRLNQLYLINHYCHIKLIILESKPLCGAMDSWIKIYKRILYSIEISNRWIT